MAHELPALPYPYDALEPNIDAQTMKLHHDLHHKSYVDGLNKAEQKLTEARQSGDLALVKHWERECAFHGSGHFLHCAFWTNMAPANAGCGGAPTGEIAKKIGSDFGNWEGCKKQFTAAATTVEGSGWCILCYRPMDDKLTILTAEKHQNLTQWGVIPLLCLDVWEHAYYLKYQNRRPEYVNNWWNVVNWKDVNNRYHKAKG